MGGYNQIFIFNTKENFMSINRPKILFSIATASLLLTNISAIEITDSRGSIADTNKTETGNKKKWHYNSIYRWYRLCRICCRC